jgi:EH domain-containing protein 1
MTDISKKSNPNKKKGTPTEESSGKTSRSGKFERNYSLEDSAVVTALRSLYKEKLLPIEKQYLFPKFNLPEILDSEISSKPNVLLIGQYSTGKTTFIRHLIGMDYPEMHIGPEPTTDRFIAVVYGNEPKIIKGNALTSVNELPFSGLSTFGSNFLNKFSAAVVPSPILKDINIIDTPGVLSGEKQRTSRGYDFAKVSRWFAERSDLILLLFDCSKLDISDEFKSVIEELQPHEDKIHCVLNKADQLDQVSLMRVYGALLWSMGRIFKGAEVSRIYVGSFHDEPLIREEHRLLFDKDKAILLSHLSQLPKACCLRKINEMVKRVRLAVVHVCLIGYLKSQLPYFWGKETQQSSLITHLDKVFEEVRLKYQLAEGDFPKLEEYRSSLQLSDFSMFPSTDRKILHQLQDILIDDIPKLTGLVAGIEDTGPGRNSNGGNGSKDDSNEESGDEGNSSSSKKDGPRSPSRQPKMFVYDEKKMNDHDHQRLFMMLAMAFCVVTVVLVFVVASWSDEDRLFYQQLVRTFIAKWIPNELLNNKI